MPLGRELGDDWTYGKDPENDPKDRVRVMVGDTDENSKLIGDSVIRWRIATSTTDTEAAYKVACDIQAEAAKHASKSGGNYSEDMAKVFEHYGTVAARLLAQCPLAIPRSAQLSRTRRETFKRDAELQTPSFSIGMLSEDAQAVTPVNNDIPSEPFPE